jgi:type IV pilus assembly protein PilQ
MLFGLAVGATGSTSDVRMLSDVSVDDVDGTTVVSLYGLADATWETAVDEEGTTVELRFDGVRPEFMPGNLVVDDPRVVSVAFAEQMGEDGRPRTIVAIHGQVPLGHDVISTGDRLEIRIVSRASALAQAPEPIEAQEPAESYEPVEVAEATAPAPPAKPAPEPEATPAAVDTASLVSVDVEGTAERTIVRMKTDGPVPDVKTFTLKDPPRLVIDLLGLVNKVRTSKIPLDLPQADRLRIGQHPDKVRLVLDGASGSGFGSRDVAVTDEGVILTIEQPAIAASEAPAVAEVAALPSVSRAGEVPPQPAADASSEMEATPEPMQPEVPMAAPVEVAVAPAGGGAASQSQAVRVNSVDLESLPDRDRLVIVLAEPTEYRVFEPDAETVVLRVLGAQIDDRAAVRLIPPSGGPISLVTSFQQPEVDLPEVRIVVTRGVGIPPEVRQQGPLLMVDFAKSAEQIAAELKQATEPLTGPEELAPAVPVVASLPANLAPATDGAVTTEPALSRIQEQIIGAGPANIDPDSPVAILQEGGFQEGKPYIGRRISLDFKDAEIDDVLRLVAEVSDLNVIAGDEVGGKVTIRLVDVPWDQALDVILMTQGLGFERVGNVLRIAPADLLQAEREARMQERRAMEKLEDLIVKLQPVNYADVKEVAKLVKRLLSGRGSVNTDERTSTLIMKDIPSVIDEATALVKAIDTQTPQVMIEAKIVEAQLDFSRELGSEWGAGTQPDEDFQDFVTGGVQPITAFGRGWPDSYANNVVVSNPITSVANGVLNLGSFLLNNRVNVNLRLAAAESRGEGKVISSPRVVTLDNREAIIEQGVSIPFQTFENGDAALEFIDAVLQLKVRPHITADRSIIMKLEVSRNAPDDSVATPTGSPAISKNEAITETLVKDGQTLVIGGIYVVEKSDTQSQVPYLHKLPFVGRAFQNKSIRDVRKELLIFVTPRVVQPQEVGT